MKNARPLLTIIAVVFLVGLAAERFAALDALGFGLLAVAGILLTVQMPPLLVRTFTRESQLEPVTRIDQIRVLFGLVVMGVGLASLAASAREFNELLAESTTPNYITWEPYLLSVVVFFTGAFILTGFGRIPRLSPVFFVLLGITCLALFLRVYHLSEYPYGVWYDEAVNGLKAREMINTPNFRPVFVDNMTALHLTIYAHALRFFGNTSIDALRLISALFGVGGVITAFMVGRELRGDAFGLLMALILAAMRWSINFSRIAMTGVEVVFFTLLVFYFALKLIREGQLRHSLWLGIVIGIGILFYRGFQTQLIAAIFLLLFSYPFRRYGVRRFFRQLIIGIVPLVVLTMPLIVFATHYEETYFGRVADTSVFNEESPDSSTVEMRLLHNLNVHAQMFNMVGDRNGRHNLSTAPMLDWITGGFFIIGLIVMLGRTWRRDLPIPNLAFALSLIVALLNGILTVSFEAPQGLRTIGAITGVTYFAALGVLAFLQTLNLGLEKTLRSKNVRYGLVGVGGVLVCAGIVGLNYYTYFYVQRTNIISWLEFSLEPSLVARLYSDYDDQTQFYVSPFINSHQSTRFLAPEALTRTTMLHVPNILPLRLPPNRNVVYMLTDTEFHYVDEIARIYPDAVIRAIRPADYGVDAASEAIFFYVIEFPRAVIASVQGLENGEGILYPPTYGEYQFITDNNTTLRINGEIINTTHPILLTEASHRFSVEPADAQIQWITPDQPNTEDIPAWYFFHEPVHFNGLEMEYYANGDWEGAPINVINAPTVFQHIHVLPMPRPYSTRYSGQIYIPETGEYGFRIITIDAAQVSIDGEMLINAEEMMKDYTETITLTQGWHDFETRHQDLTSSSRIFLRWSTPNEPRYIPIQAEYFCVAADLCAVPNSP